MGGYSVSGLFVRKPGSLSVMGKLLGRPVFYWLELRVMGITQCQGITQCNGRILSVRFVCEETRVPQCHG
jgi:hypothetical protein